jgi:hypothetical protein
MSKRYLRARPGGVLTWLSVGPPSLERRLFEHLLGAPEAVEFNVPALAARFSLPARTLARALFALNRHASVAVQDAADPLPAAASPALREAVRPGLAGLEQDLIDIVQAQGEMLLACSDGFCIARAGLSPQRAQQLAARLPLGDEGGTSFRTALCFGDRRLHFYASAGIDLKHPLMLRLGARLLRGCGLPGITTG